MVPATMSLFDLLQFLALFVCEISSHLPVGLSHGFMNTPGGVSPNFSKLVRCFVDDRRNFGDLLRRQVELGAESFLHSCADQFWPMKFNEVMLRVKSAKERATDSAGDKYEKESCDEFPLQRAVHLKNSS
jgi:hypothetical protein